MSRTGWLVGTIFLAAGAGAVWLGLARDTDRAAGRGVQAPLVSADGGRLGNTLTGEEAQEPIAPVVEVIDLAQVFEPRFGDQDDWADQTSAADRPIGAAFGVGAGMAPLEPFVAPRLMPYAADGLPVTQGGWSDDPFDALVPGIGRRAPRYGEETSEPPAAGRAGGWTDWLREGCASLLFRMMPLKGSSVPAESGSP